MMNSLANDKGHRQQDVLTSAHHDGAKTVFCTRQVMRGALHGYFERNHDETVSSRNLSANKLLTALQEEDLDRLQQHLEPVTLYPGKNLNQFDDGVHFAYFPETSVLSHLYISADGDTTEAAMIGHEGVAGLSAILSSGQPGYCTRVLIAGSALRMKIDIFKQEFWRGSSLQQVLLGYASARMAQLSQRVVCSGRHKVEERLCCWLLMVSDRAGEDQLHLTHELIATHLGTRRASISECAISLRDRGIIGYHCGQLHILERQRLEAAACECYQTFSQLATRVA